MNHTLSDREILDRVESDMKTTISFLKSRVLAQFADLQTVGRSGVLSEEIAKDFDDYMTDLMADVVDYTRVRIEAAAELQAAE
jgi:hypothetical protein